MSDLRTDRFALSTGVELDVTVGGAGEPLLFLHGFPESRRTWRHQLADLSQGSVDADGCLVCPWHQARYDLHTGEMVSGPRGFLGYHGPTPGYSGLVKRVGQVVRLRVRRARRQGPDVVVD